MYPLRFHEILTPVPGDEDVADDPPLHPASVADRASTGSAEIMLRAIFTVYNLLDIFIQNYDIFLIIALHKQ